MIIFSKQDVDDPVYDGMCPFGTSVFRWFTQLYVDGQSIRGTLVKKIFKNHHENCLSCHTAILYNSQWYLYFLCVGRQWCTVYSEDFPVGEFRDDVRDAMMILLVNSTHNDSFMLMSQHYDNY